ncbi:hypothetical protein, partial [Faecalibacterium prausnitzii]|uniref:hypothetical protein n=1 Tax=Faecalibacterium prausnitzii TaxID=853 RepID=UPI0019D62F31
SLCFCRLQKSFFPAALALKYNTTSPAFCQHFFASFLSFFYISQNECFRAGFCDIFLPAFLIYIISAENPRQSI